MGVGSTMQASAGWSHLLWADFCSFFQPLLTSNFWKLKETVEYENSLLYIPPNEETNLHELENATIEEVNIGFIFN